MYSTSRGLIVDVVFLVVRLSELDHLGVFRPNFIWDIGIWPWRNIPPRGHPCTSEIERAPLFAASGRGRGGEPRSLAMTSGLTR